MVLCLEVPRQVAVAEENSSIDFYAVILTGGCDWSFLEDAPEAGLATCCWEEPLGLLLYLYLSWSCSLQVQEQ